VAAGGRRHDSESKEWLAKDSECFITLLLSCVSGYRRRRRARRAWDGQKRAKSSPDPGQLSLSPAPPRVSTSSLGPCYRLLTSPAHAPAVGRGSSARVCASLDEIVSSIRQNSVVLAALLRFTMTSDAAVRNTSLRAACSNVKGKAVRPYSHQSTSCQKAYRALGSSPSEWSF
jgi:hypothetical protein